MLALLVREPFSAVTPEVYDGLTDWQILHVYLAPHKEKGLGPLIPIRERFRERRLGRKRFRGAAFPSMEEVGMPAEALTIAPAGMSTSYALLYWQVWRGRGLTSEQVMERWRRNVCRK